MYKRQWYTQLRSQLIREDKSKLLKGRYVLLLQVEFGLYLLERLGLAGEPADTLWVVLSGLELPNWNLDARQRQIRARGCVLSPYSGRFAWEAALREYMDIPAVWRAYSVEAKELPSRSVQSFACQTGNHRKRFEVYEHHLAQPIPSREHGLNAARAGEQVKFDLPTRAGIKHVEIKVSDEIAALGETSPIGFAGLRTRQPVTITWDEVQQAAQEMEQRAINWAGAIDTHWPARAARVRFRAVRNGTLGVANESALVINGLAHVAGMVGSGKTTLMKILAYILARRGQRVTLIVGDVASVLDLADEFNRLLDADPDAPVAVPLLGRTTRDQHLRRLYASDRFHQLAGDHWGLRWLGTTCPWQSQTPTQLPQIASPGEEPCQKLSLASEIRNDGAADEVEDSDSGQRRLCPLFQVCPAQQIYRDMPNARIWITTPGALSQANFPAQADPRRLKLWEVVYEQSDLVVFDEVDAVQHWYDVICAPDASLASGDGLLDRIDIWVSRAWAKQRELPVNREQWVLAQQLTSHGVGHVLSLLARHTWLADWVDDQYFAARTLLYRSARRIAGLNEKDLDDEEAQSPTRTIGPAAQKTLDDLTSCFEAFMESDPQHVVRPRSGDHDAVYRLQQIAQSILVQGDSASECRAWLIDFVPDLAQTLSRRQSQHNLGDGAGPSVRNRARWKKTSPVDSLENLAVRLEFVVSVAVLDKTMQNMFDRWDFGLARDLNDRLQRAPDDLYGLLPVPATGRLFGFYYRRPRRSDAPPGDEVSDASPLFSVFEYAHIGRRFVMNFHRLRAEIDERPGPNVLALSGTSWMPRSSRWHFNIPPIGVLEPEPREQDAIASSEFFYLPQYEPARNGTRPIRVSGSGALTTQLKKVVTGLARGEFAPLRAELDWLAEHTESPLWQDRQRVLLLVNSYEQVEVVAHEIASLTGWNDEVFGLQAASNDWVSVSRWHQSLLRNDVESFALTKGKILVAPMMAISRGYNILNENRVAAFGTIYFLTRPMPHPFDTSALASEMNHQTLAWLEKPEMKLWQGETVLARGLALRRYAGEWWRRAENRYGYRSMDTAAKYDLAASTAGLIIQSCGRLLRGGVPFRAYFVDAAWGANGSDQSLLAMMIQVLNDYANDPIGGTLYAPLAQALSNIRNFEIQKTTRSH